MEGMRQGRAAREKPMAGAAGAGCNKVVRGSRTRSESSESCCECSELQRCNGQVEALGWSGWKHSRRLREEHGVSGAVFQKEREAQACCIQLPGLDTPRCKSTNARIQSGNTGPALPRCQKEDALRLLSRGGNSNTAAGADHR